MAEALTRPTPVETLCLALTHTGCRLSEALALTAADIDAERGLIAVRCLKKRNQIVIREVPVPPDFVSRLCAAHRQAFAGSGSGRLWPWGRTRAWQIVKEVMRDAGIAGAAASPKGLRHAFGVHAVLSGVPLTLLQKWLGHADIATTAIYTDIVGQEEILAARRMW